MSDAIDGFRDLKDFRRAKRAIWGKPCPKCREEQPKREATTLEPGRICKVHRPWFRDPRPEPTEAEFEQRMAEHGWLPSHATTSAGETADV